MPTNLVRPANSWNVATQGNPTWQCRIKHKWQYLEADKLRACERCGQMQGRRDYLRWLIGPTVLGSAWYDNYRPTLPPMPKPPPAPPPKVTP